MTLFDVILGVAGICVGYVLGWRRFRRDYSPPRIVGLARRPPTNSEESDP